MDRVGRYLADQIDARRMPGAVGAVAGPQGVVGRWVLGRAAIEPRPVDVAADTLYDLASLTKPLCTALALVLLEQRGNCSLDDPASRWLPELKGSPCGDVTLVELAAHVGGLPAWQPLYLEGAGAASFLHTIAAQPDGPRGETVYSDLGYIALGFAVERIAGCPLDRWFEESVARALGLAQLGFATRIDCSAAAPTERGNAYERGLAGDAGAGHAWRESMIRGEVHDGNAYALGGVAGHSGLFGTLADVLSLASEILEPRRLDLGDEARRRLLTEAVPGSRRTVGFVQAAGSNAARGVFADDAPGHVGFAGPSLWLEPDRGFVYLLLTNRVHPQVDGADFQPLRLGFHRLARELTA